MSGPVAGGRTQVMALAIGVEGGLAALAIGIGRLFSQPPLETIRIDWSSLLVGLLATLPLLAAFFLLLRWPVPWLDPIRRFSLDVLCPALSPCSVPDLFAISLLAGFGEEMLFRGTLQTLFTRWAMPWIGLAAASLLFGVIHAVTPTYAVVAALIGGYLGFLFQATGNILTPILVHSIYDFAVLVYLLAGPGRSLWERQANGGGSVEMSVTSDDAKRDSVEHFAAACVSQ